MTSHFSRCGVPLRSLLRHLLALVAGLLVLTGSSLAADISLAWDAVAGATGYTIGWGGTSGQYTQTLDAGNKTTGMVTQLLPGTYYFAVRAYNATTTSGYSNEVSAAIPSAAAPVASFTASPTTGTAPLKVTLNDTSTGTVTSRSWVSGDPADTTPLASSAQVTKTYSSPGEYVVVLTVANSAGSTSVTQTITVTAAGPDTNPPPSAEVPMEIGEAQVTHAWQFVEFSPNSHFNNPIVVATPLSGNDASPAVVRIKDIGPNGFWIRAQEWDYLDGIHGLETVSYMVMESGSYDLGGARVEAGRLRTNATNAFASRSFTTNTPFVDVPIVFATVTSVNETSAVATRLRNISRTGFQVGMQEQQANRQTHKTENIDYIAWEPSVGEVNGLRYEVDLMSSKVTNKVQTLVYESGPFTQPRLLAEMQTTNDGDRADLRWGNRNKESVDVWVSEEQSKDTEVTHGAESVGYFVLDSDSTGPIDPPPPTVSVCATPCSLWNGTATPSLLTDSDTSPVELGVKFRSDVDGYVTGVRYYKSSQNTGVHVGSLWSSTGQLLANATFSSETTSGWQSVKFPTPVAIKANTVYVVSYHTNAGRYSVDEGYFASAYGNGPLRALANGESGGNGLYLYGGGGFPTNTYGASNYWVDAIFTTP